MTVKQGMRGLFRGVGIAIIILIFTIPYLWLVGSSFKPRDEIFRNIYPFTWKTFIPVEPTLDNFRNLFAETDFARSLLLSVGIAVVTVIISLFICSMIAFVLARLEAFVLILATMLIPFEARIVPLFFVMQDLNLDNTIPAIFLPWVADAFIIFLLRQHFKELPDDLYDSAVVDGCSHFHEQGCYLNTSSPVQRPSRARNGLRVGS